ncbi:hnRNP-L/PTB family RNA-binding protein [Neorhodopirellula pilleata]|uniref:Uncharacterized protein n=1 Tax=Neorhodopirellula pilleata TaxID=2714738 RepID=A0A5C6AN75_9BACT|nr:hypothetical protein [Neorhodopirellula pilleata]TWU01455.1 hypothetical protein Pla100_11890 [Neorhodopirellula pilleata]
MLHLPSRSARWTLLAASAVILPGLGCRQAGTPNGFTGAAPLTSLPGQTATTGPLLPALGPFGASARVPPPSTGSYGATAANMGFGGSNSAAGSYAPAGYAPGAVQPMSFEQPIGSGVPNPVANPVGGVGPTNWSDSSGNPNTSGNPTGSTGSSLNQIRSGGMQVIDLTSAATPPSNQAAWGPTQSSPAPVPSATVPSTTTPPISGGGFANSAPAANQPAFSTADRPLQWQTPRR